jgi:hypothetical protein
MSAMERSSSINGGLKKLVKGAVRVGSLNDVVAGVCNYVSRRHRRRLARLLQIEIHPTHFDFVCGTVEFFAPAIIAVREEANFSVLAWVEHGHAKVELTTLKALSLSIIAVGWTGFAKMSKSYPRSRASFKRSAVRLFPDTRSTLQLG